MKSPKKAPMPVFLGSLFAATATLQASGTNVAPGNSRSAQVLTLSLDSMDGLALQSFNEDDAKPLRTKTEVTTYRGRKALHVSTLGDGQALFVIKNSEFKSGTIEAEIAAAPGKSAPPDARGFVGISFHVQEHAARYETMYLRMTNGRADEQLRRNHSAQYESVPEFPWNRLRKESPGVYESYVDVKAGAWTSVKVVVKGVRAALYVNGAEQPCLIVNDLKLGETAGPVALWSGYDTEAYFSKLNLD